MNAAFIHHRIEARPHSWKSVAEAIAAQRTSLKAAGGSLYGIWRSQIGRPRDELTAMTTWAEGADHDVAQRIIGEIADVRAVESTAMMPTLRPTEVAPPRRQGNFAFRWFETPEQNWGEFLDLCAAAWPGFEGAYDSQVIGLWRAIDSAPGMVRSLLLTRRPDLAMWERSKLPQGEAEADVRAKLSRRYDLCDATVVYTTTLITADDREDTARWT